MHIRQCTWAFIPFHTYLHMYAYIFTYIYIIPLELYLSSVYIYLYKYIHVYICIIKKKIHMYKKFVFDISTQIYMCTHICISIYMQKNGHLCFQLYICHAHEYIHLRICTRICFHKYAYSCGRNQEVFFGFWICVNHRKQTCVWLYMPKGRKCVSKFTYIQNLHIYV